jgi:hypothetical protein
MFPIVNLGNTCGSNLFSKDPFSEYSDAECIEALNRQSRTSQSPSSILIAFLSLLSSGVHLRTSDSPSRSLATSRAASIKDGVTTPMIAGVVEPEDVGREGVQAAITVPDDPASDDSETLVPTAASVAPSTPGGNGSGRTIFTLETKVSEGGNNFSQGQRQLLSMARA